MRFRCVELDVFIGRRAHVEQQCHRDVALGALAPPVNFFRRRAAGAPIDEPLDHAVEMQILAVKRRVTLRNSSGK